MIKYFQALEKKKELTERKVKSFFIVPENILLTYPLDKRVFVMYICALKKKLNQNG